MPLPTTRKRPTRIANGWRQSSPTSRWYAARLGEERCEVPPRPGRWSLAENIWHITEQASAAADSSQPRPVVYYIDHGKEHVGQAAEIFALFEY